MGSWAIEDGRLEIGQLASTMMYCDGLMELEGAFLAALQGATSAASLDGERLILADDDRAARRSSWSAVEAPPAP